MKIVLYKKKSSHIAANSYVKHCTTCKLKEIAMWWTESNKSAESQI
jgi:hypothetical protein